MSFVVCRACRQGRLSERGKSVAYGAFYARALPNLAPKPFFQNNMKAGFGLLHVVAQN